MLPTHSPTNGGLNGLQKTTYLVTGASRGIGKGLVAAFLERPNSIVVACVRDVASSQTALNQLPKSDSTNLIIVKLDCAEESSASAAIQELQHKHKILHLDVVIANAAIAANYGPASMMELAHLQTHMMVNTYAVLLLFQAARPLMQAAGMGAGKHGPPPKFVYIGAPISTITDMENCARAPLTAYGVTKLAGNYLVRKFHFENRWLVAFIVDPGHVQTDMGDQGARLMGRKEAPTTIQDSVSGICTRIDEATKEETSGHFVLYEDGSKLPW